MEALVTRLVQYGLAAYYFGSLLWTFIEPKFRRRQWLKAHSWWALAVLAAATLMQIGWLRINLFVNIYNIAGLPYDADIQTVVKQCQFLYPSPSPMVAELFARIQTFGPHAGAAYHYAGPYITQCQWCATETGEHEIIAAYGLYMLPRFMVHHIIRFASIWMSANISPSAMVWRPQLLLLAVACLAHESYNFITAKYVRTMGTSLMCTCIFGLVAILTVVLEAALLEPSRDNDPAKLLARLNRVVAETIETSVIANKVHKTVLETPELSAEAAEFWQSEHTARKQARKLVAEQFPEPTQTRFTPENSVNVYSNADGTSHWLARTAAGDSSSVLTTLSGH